MPGRALRWMVNTPWFHAVASTAFLFVALVAAMIRWDHLTIIIPIAVVFEQLLGMWRKDAAEAAARRSWDIRPRKKPTIRDRTPRLWVAAVVLIAIPVAAGHYLQTVIDQIEAMLPADWLMQAIAAGLVLVILWIEAAIRAHDEAEPETENPRRASIRRGT